jgi:monofunctional biosynthetic peptidoglycan transglycosylase
MPAGPIAATRAPLWRRALRVLRIGTEVMTVLAAVGALALWCSVPSTKSLAEDNPRSTAFIDLRRDEAEAAGRTFQLRWQWRPIGKISRYLRAAVIYAEDYNFYRHDGIDWGALEDAIEANLDKGSFAIGGSTITQQLAKNLYLSPSRSLLRKAREMLIAFALEDHLSKQRILELYLNVVEWGDGIFGAEAASRYWFGHTSQTLTPAEAVRLAVALPNPFTRAPNLRTPEMRKKSIRLVHLLRLQGLIDEPQERAALDQVGAPTEKTLQGPRKREPKKPESSPTPAPSAPTPDTQPSVPEPTAPEPATPDPAATPPAPIPTLE